MNWWTLDHTHDEKARSWVAGADGHPSFPVQNLPLGLFADNFAGPRAGVAIGDFILDLAGIVDAGLLPELDFLSEFTRERLNELLSLGAEVRRELRHALFALLTDTQQREAVTPFLIPAELTEMYLPCEIGDYSGFTAGIHHAARLGQLLGAESALPPYYHHAPIGHHGRASSVVVSGTPIHRPGGQLSTPQGPRSGPAEQLDMELELGVWIGPGNDLGSPISIADANEHIAGFCLLNNWSARDIQQWEYPQAPFLSKNFLTSISPWIITPEALAPFRRPAFARTDTEAAPLPYLLDTDDQAHGGLQLELSAWLQTSAMRDHNIPEQKLSVASSADLYWTVQQLVAQHTIGGCNLNAGDLFGTGTICGAESGTEGSLMEITEGGKRPIALPNGETRLFLQAGDRIRIAAEAHRPGYATIGFGLCVGEVID